MSFDYNKQQLKFEAAVAQGKWFSVGFGTKMYERDKNVDMIIFSATGGGSIVDAYSTSYRPPSTDSESHLVDQSITVENGIYKFVCFRDLDTGDDEDHAFTLD
jgi:hypothetical protein